MAQLNIYVIYEIEREIRNEDLKRGKSFSEFISEKIQKPTV